MRGLKVSAALLCLLAPLGLKAQGAAGWSEAEVVARALEAPWIEAALSGAEQAAAGQARRVGALRDPALTLQHVQVGDELEQGLGLAWELELSGARGLRASAGAARLEATRQRGLARRAERVAEARRRWGRLRWAQAQVGAGQRWREALRRATASVRLRAAAGDVSAYDQMRLERELSAAEAELRRREGVAALAWGQLWALLAGAEALPRAAPALEGPLLPALPPPPEALVEALAAAPTLQALSLEAAAGERAAAAATRGWIPKLSLSGGYRRRQSTVEDAHGYGLGLGLSLPLFGEVAGAAGEGAGKARVAQARYAAALREAQGVVAGLWTQAEALKRGAEGAAAAMKVTAAQLVPTAEAAYRGGELGVLELVDAYRSLLEDEDRAATMAWEARAAVVELDRLMTGEDT